HNLKPCFTGKLTLKAGCLAELLTLPQVSILQIHLLLNHCEDALQIVRIERKDEGNLRGSRFH
ncbi:MAG: hypothetical protein QNK43_09145, partial [Amphritea sp.]|nr:hypothetical protein [Amphritea sp.]